MRILDVGQVDLLRPELTERAHMTFAGKRPTWHRPRYSLVLGRGALYDPTDGILWEEDWQPNALTNDGSTSIDNVYLKAGAQITTTYLGLVMASTSNAPSATTHSTDLTQAGAGGGSTVSEEGGGGYTRQTILSTDWGSITISAGSQTTAAQKTFGPVTTAAWTGAAGASAAITHAHMITTGTAFSATGTLILYIALSASTIVAIGQSFLYTLTFKQA